VLIQIPNVLTATEVARCRDALNQAAWADGRHSAGYLSQSVKRNTQLSENDTTGRELGELILIALEKNSLFTAAALPLKVLPPQFNRYSDGQSYGGHIDGARRPVTGTPHRIRTDLSATLFLSEPETYEGGELVMKDTFGERSAKLPAGDMVLYPGSSVHRVEPVTRGVRLAAFFWIQSVIRDSTHRTILFELDSAIQRLGGDLPENSTLVELAGVYHNLLRCWADT
jgi:PKHD-type hydroxylase